MRNEPNFGAGRSGAHVNGQPKHTEPDESLDRDVTVERAFQFFLGEKGWRPSHLARESGVSLDVVHQAVRGYAPSVATLQRLCISLEVDLWMFFLMADLLRHEDPTAFLEPIIDRLTAMRDEILEAEPPS